MIGIVMAGGKGSRININADDMSFYSDHTTSLCKDDHIEKLLFCVPSHTQSHTPSNTSCKKPLVAHVIDMLLSSGCMSKVFVITSDSNAPATRAKIYEMYGDNSSIHIIDSQGAGYSQDLQDALHAISHDASVRDGDTGALVVSGDMPFLDTRIILSIANHYAKNMCTCIVVSKTYAALWNHKFEYDVFVNDYNKNDDGDGGVLCYYTGISMVDLNCVDSSTYDNLPQRHVILDDHRVAISINTLDDYTTYIANSTQL